MEKLIGAGAPINAIDDNGESPLFDAARVGSLQTAKFLVEHGADIDLANKNNKTALDLANENGQSKVSSFLIQAGAKLE